MANEQVQISVGVNAAGVQQGMDKVGQQAQRTGQQAAQATNRAAAATETWRQGLNRIRATARLFGADLIGRLGAAYGVLASFDKIVNQTAENWRRMAEISKASQKAGINAEDYQRVSRVAEATGASIDAAAEAAGRYARMISQASAGNQDAIGSLRELGFADEQIRKGTISTIDVLARLSARYRSAATEAERLRIAERSGVPKEVLEAGPAKVAMEGATPVATQQEVEIRARNERMAKESGGVGARIGNFFADLFSGQMGGGAARNNESEFFKQMPGQSQYAGAEARRISEISGQLKNEGLGAEERGKLEQELLALFSVYAKNFRDTFQGSIQGGQVQTEASIQRELERKLGELIPSLKTPEGGLPISPLKDGEAGQVASGVSSLQTIGGGGGFYAGAVDMVNLATRTADATERSATALEKLAGTAGTQAPTPSPVSAD